MIESYYMFTEDTLIRNGIPEFGAVELLRLLDDRNFGYVILTELSHRSRSGLALQMNDAGFQDVRSQDIYNSVQAACDWIRWKQPKKDKAVIIGGKGMKETLLASGFEIDPKHVDWVFLGMNSSLTYADYCEAVQLIESGAELIVTDERRTFTRNGKKMIATGSIAAMLEEASGKVGYHFGRGTMNLLKYGVQYFNVDPSLITMVGTDFEKDIIPAIRLGMRTVLVTQGRSLDELGITEELHPHYIVDTLIGLTK